MVIQILTLPAHDKVPLEVRLCLPDKGRPEKIVVFVNGSGPQTCTTKRQMPDSSFFNYFDIFAEEFTSLNIGFCSYSQRGVRDGDTPPFFVEINEPAYRQYLPHNSVSDIQSIVTYLNDRYPVAKLILMGWSEGTIIAPLVALSGNVKISALVLAGYCNENLRDILIWQLSGNSVLTQWCRLFDYDRKGYITETDLKEDRYHVRNAIFGDKPFSEFDRDGDGKITVVDTAPISTPHLQNILRAIDENDDEWLKNNHGVRLTTGWFKEHFALKPTKEILPRLDLPIHIFSGEYDAMTPLWQAQEIDAEFKKLGKTNLTLHTFDHHDHDLNILKYIIKKEHSDGMIAIFETVERLN